MKKRTVDNTKRLDGKSAIIIGAAPGIECGFAVLEDLAGMAVFLAPSESDYILSQTYNVDGGQWMS